MIYEPKEKEAPVDRPDARVIGDGVFLASLAITGLLERLQFRLREREQRRWWISNGRDVLNGLAFGAMSLGLAAVGIPGPRALVLAALLLLLVSGVQAALGDRRLSGWLALSVALALGAPVLIAPDSVSRFAGAILSWFF